MLARQIAIGFGIAFIFPLLIHYGVSSFYPAPKMQSYITTKLVPPGSATAEERKAYNDERQNEQNAYAEAAKQFARVLVLVATPLGVAAILVGAFLAIQSIGAGLIVGGIFTVAWGYWSYWSYLDDRIRFVSLLAGFAILLFVGVRRTAGRKTATDSSA